MNVPPRLRRILNYAVFLSKNLFFSLSRSYLKNADYVQEQEAHLNQYNQMCYPAYAGARADEKAQHTGSM